SRLHSFFKISVDTPIFLSHTDKDGDIITLSSDLELLEVVSAQEYDNEKFGNNTFLKFALIIPGNEVYLEEDENDSWVLEGSTTHIEDLTYDSNDNDSNWGDRVLYNDSSDNELISQREVVIEEPTFNPTISARHVPEKILQNEKNQLESDLLQHRLSQYETINEASSKSANTEHQHSKIINEKRDDENARGVFFPWSWRSSFISPQLLPSSRVQFSLQRFYLFKEITKTLPSILLFITFMKLFTIAFCPLIAIFLLSKGLKLIKDRHGENDKGRAEVKMSVDINETS
ncbi:11414_t:CDS:1, partial [Acaulospora morrowiae]